MFSIEPAGDNTMNAIATQLVWKYFVNHFDTTYGVDNTHDIDVYEVWHCYILGNEKWLMATTYPDGMYYEVTYNKSTHEWYLDAYRREKNIKIDDDVIRHLL